MKLVLKDGGLLMKDGKPALAEKPCDCCEKPCGTTSGSGGSGVTVNEYAMPDKEGEVTFTCDAFSIPDAFKVEGGGQVFVDTGSMSNSKTYKFCKPKGLRKIKVTVTGPNGTGWVYTLGCPDSPCSATPDPPTTSPTRATAEQVAAEELSVLRGAARSFSLETPAESGGPGSELEALFAKFWMRPSEDCGCQERALYMDEMGPDWCRQNMGLISSWLAEAAREKGLPYFEAVGRMAIERAISNWESRAGR